MQAQRLAGLAALVVEHAEQMQRVEVVALRLQHARVELLRLVEPALLVQRQRLLDRLARVERTGFACSQAVDPGDPPGHVHRRSVVGRVLQRERFAGGGTLQATHQPGLEMRHRAQVHLDGAADDGSDVEIGNGEVVAEQIGLLRSPRRRAP